MDIKSGAVWPASELSNFAFHPFVFRGVPCDSMEGLLQGLKFEEVPVQAFVCLMHGAKAKKAGKARNAAWQAVQTLWWQGKPIARQSEEFQALLDEAFEAMFTQCEEARKALLATGEEAIDHSMGKTDPTQTVLTIEEFVSRLVKVRSKFQANL